MVIKAMAVALQTLLAAIVYKQPVKPWGTNYRSPTSSNNVHLYLLFFIFIMKNGFYDKRIELIVMCSIRVVKII